MDYPQDKFGNCSECGGGIEGGIPHMPDCKYQRNSMTAEEIRKLDASGTGPEEEFRNRMLQEIAAQLAEIARELESFGRTWPGPR